MLLGISSVGYHGLLMRKTSDPHKLRLLQNDVEIKLTQLDEAPHSSKRCSELLATVSNNPSGYTLPFSLLLWFSGSKHPYLVDSRCEGPPAAVSAKGKQVILPTAPGRRCCPRCCRSPERKVGRAEGRQRSPMFYGHPTPRSARLAAPTPARGRGVTHRLAMPALRTAVEMALTAVQSELRSCVNSPVPFARRPSSITKRVMVMTSVSKAERSVMVPARVERHRDPAADSAPTPEGGTSPLCPPPAPPPGPTAAGPSPGSVRRPGASRRQRGRRAGIMAPGCCSSGGVWSPLSGIAFEFWVVACGARSWTR